MAKYRLVEYACPTTGSLPIPWNAKTPTSRRLDLLNGLSLVFRHATIQAGDLAWKLRFAELCVMTSLVEFSGSLRQDSLFSKAPLRYRQLALEAVGLAMLSDIVDTRDGPLVNVFDFDSVRFRGAGLKRRPDLRFYCKSGALVSGEARGRTAKRNRFNTATAEQRSRWTDLSAVPGRLCISWTYVGAANTQVSFFDPGDPIPTSNDEAATLRNLANTYYNSLHDSAPLVRFGAAWDRLGLHGEWARLPKGWLFAGVTTEPLEPARSATDVADDEGDDQGGVLWQDRFVLAYAPPRDGQPDLNRMAEQSGLNTPGVEPDR